MALRAIGQILSFDFDPTEGLKFKLKIITTDNPPFSTDNHWTPYTGLNAGDSASTINSWLMTYIKNYCEDTFSITIGILDTIRILAAVDSIL